MPGINEWIQNEALQVWDQVKSTVVLDVLRCNLGNSYFPDDYKSFFEKESVESEIYLFVPEGNFTVNQYCEFDSAIKDIINGYIRIYFLGEKEYSSLYMVDYIDKDPELSIRIGAPKSVIENVIGQEDGGIK